MNRFLRVALPVLTLLVSSAASAQTVPSSYRYFERSRSLTAYIGYLNTSPRVALPDSQSAELGPQSTPLFGLRYSMRIGGPLSVEANLGFAPAERKLYDADPNADSTAVEVEDTGTRVPMNLGMMDLALRFHLTGDRTYKGLAPFVLASGGVVTVLGSRAAADTALPVHRRVDFGPGLALGLGTGVDYFLTPRTSLRAEASYRLWKIETPGGLLPRGNAQRSEWSGNAGISLGAAYHF